jgi:RNA polymerase sigma-70 factor, ECF subfamily
VTTPLPQDKVKELYERFGPAIFSRCRRLLRDAIAAEDATQEVFLRVLKHIDSAPEDAAVLAWIYRISTNYCLNVLRDGARHAEPVSSADESMVGDFEDSVVSRELTERLMKDAPEELRAPVLLYHVKGMEQAAIARALGVSRRTVLYRLAEFSERARHFVALAEAGLA